MTLNTNQDIRIECVSTTDFIGVYDTTFDPSYLLEWYNYTDSSGLTVLRGREELFSSEGSSERLKDTGFTTHFWDEAHRESVNGYELSLSTAHEYVRLFHNVISTCVQMYAQEFRTVANYTLHHDDPNIQKTSPGGGYHVWHCEDCQGSSDRKLVTMMYLNDGFEGGETEWLYLSRREKPKTGRVIIFPAGFTHTHRGNPPLNGDKYIATSWVRDCSQPVINLQRNA